MVVTRAEFAVLLKWAIRGRTQAEVAGRIGVSQSSMSRYLSGTERPSPKNAGRIARAYPELAEPLAALLLWDAGGRGNGAKEEVA